MAERKDTWSIGMSFVLPSGALSHGWVGGVQTATPASALQPMSAPDVVSRDAAWDRFKASCNHAFRLQTSGRSIEAKAVIASYTAAITAIEPYQAVLTDQQRSYVAAVYVNRGAAKASAAGHGPGAAIADYDRAIALMEALRQELEPQGAWDPGLRDGLARAYMNRGVAKQDAAGHGPGAAIADYDRAIALMEALRQELEPQGKWDQSLRNGLTMAYMNRGVAKQDAAGHGPGAAIADYDRAIALMEALRQELEPQGKWDQSLRNSLASTYVNRGAAKRDAEGHELTAALTDYLHASDLLTPLLYVASSIFPPAIETKLRATLGTGRALQALRRPEEATDVADDALRVGRLAEQVGVSWYRPLREEVFAQALDIYRAAGMAAFLPELIFDDLDPAAPGSAVNSAPMHQAAVAALVGAVADLAHAETPDAQERRDTLLHAQVRLAAVQTGWFAGSADLARINAAAEATAGRTEEGERILTRQITWRPTDPEGFAARADFLARLGRREAASADFLHAARLSSELVAIPTDEGVAPVAALGAALLHLRLDALADDAALSDPAQGRATRDAFMTLNTWLVHELPTAILAGLPAASRDAWRGPLVAALLARQVKADALRETILAAQERRWEGDLRARIARSGRRCTGT